jgi:hypothetical protein
MTRWAKANTGDWHSSDSRWHVRNAPMSAGKWWWLYGPRPKPGAPASRYTPTGRHADSVGFKTAREAMRYADRLDGITG